MSDPRFSRIHTDPRFRRLKKSENKVVVDERFKSLFDNNDESTQKKPKGGRVDKYGRRISDNHEKDNLRRFYRLEGEKNKEAAPQPDVPQFVDYARGEVLLESSDEESDGSASIHESDGDEDDGREIVLGWHSSKPIPVLAEEEELEVNLKEEDDNAYADLDAQAVAYAKEHAFGDIDDQQSSETGTKTCRLAIVNLDWDHIRASHLYRILSSLVSPAAASTSITANAAILLDSNRAEKPEKKSSVKVVRGKILSVRVYPSEFGKERMKREEAEGPPKEIFKKSRRDGGDLNGDLIQEDEGDEFDEDALRKYQLERLLYYYAIVTCDSVEAASHVVSELDGTELERSANVFDLSYVPNDMEFDDDFRDEATPTTDAALTNYASLDFSTEALRHSKVTLKWDEDDPERYRITRRALTRKEIEDGDYQALIASSGSEDEDGSGEVNAVGNGIKDRESLRKLLLSGGDDDMPEGWVSHDPFEDGDKLGADGEMEITFMPGLSEVAKDEEETTLERYKRKQKEKRQQRKKEQKEQQLPEGRKKDERTDRFNDDFFGEDSEKLESGEETAGKEPNSKVRHKSRREHGNSVEEVRPATEAELELLVASEDGIGKNKHFDMKSIIKAEKHKGRKGNKGKKPKKKGEEDELQGDFQIDVKDERFKALHEDYAFAIDPSNPHFKKTKSMNALLEERTRRRREKRSQGMVGDGSERKDSLQSLVERVKRKSRDADGKGIGKRRKAD